MESEWDGELLEWDEESKSVQGRMLPSSPSVALMSLFESVLMGPAAPDLVAGELVVVAMMRCRADEFGPKESRQLGRVLVERYQPLGPVAQAVLSVPAAVAAEARRRRAEGGSQ